MVTPSLVIDINKSNANRAPTVPQKKSRLESTGFLSVLDLSAGLDLMLFLTDCRSLSVGERWTACARPLSRLEWLRVCVCLMEDQEGSRCRQGAWLSVC